MIQFLTLKSLKHRKFTASLCILSIALSVALFLGIERIRSGAKDGFTNTISHTDLIVGAKGGPLQLLLYTVFHIGGAVNNIRMASYEKIKSHPQVEWAIPISLGDSYLGFRVVATDENFFKHYQFRGDHHIEFKEGSAPQDTFDVVIGSDVALKLHLKLNDPIILSHGIASANILSHDATPFHIKGILSPTQTPIDTAVYINLYGMEAMHMGWESGMPSGDKINPDRYKMENIKITQLTSFLIKLKSRIAVLKMRRQIDQFEDEPIMAIIPGLTLQEMWQTIGYVEQILFLVSLCVLFVGALSILISLYTSINERRREMAILRSLGASAIHILLLLLFESGFLVLLGCLSGLTLLYLLLFTIRPWLEANFSVYLPVDTISSTEWYYLLAVFLTGLLAGLIPSIKAYLTSLQDGLTIKY